MVNTIAKKVDDGEGVVHNHPLKELNFTQENRVCVFVCIKQWDVSQDWTIRRTSNHLQ